MTRTLSGLSGHQVRTDTPSPIGVSGCPLSGGRGRTLIDHAVIGSARQRAQSTARSPRRTERSGVQPPSPNVIKTSGMTMRARVGARVTAISVVPEGVRLSGTTKTYWIPPAVVTGSNGREAACWVWSGISSDERRP